jgi:hypothetical protein
MTPAHTEAKPLPRPISDVVMISEIADVSASAPNTTAMTRHAITAALRGLIRLLLHVVLLRCDSG